MITETESKELFVKQRDQERKDKPLILEELCKHCGNKEFEFRGIQKLKYKDNVLELDLYVCKCCKGHETHLYKGHVVTEQSLKEYFKK